MIMTILYQIILPLFSTIVLPSSNSDECSSRVGATSMGEGVEEAADIAAITSSTTALVRTFVVTSAVETVDWSQ